MRFLTLLFVLVPLAVLSQTGPSVLLANSIGIQVNLNPDQVAGESFNSSTFVGIRSATGFSYGIAVTANALIRIPHNEVGFFGGYTSERYMGLIAAKLHNSTIDDNKFGIQGMFAVSWEFTKGMAIGPSLFSNVIFDQRPVYSIGVGLMVKNL